MMIRQQASMRTLSKEERQNQTMESIRELEEMHERGDIETHSYLYKKRVLIRRL